MKPTDHFVNELTSNQAKIHAYIFAALGNHADSDDVFQKTNIVLWKKADQFDEKRPFLPWALGIARFEILAHHRDRGRDKLIFQEDVVQLISEATVDHLDEVTSRTSALRRCLKTLRQKDRDLISLKYVDGCSIEEISQRCHKSQDGVKSLLMRIRKALRGCIQQNLLGSES